MNIIKDTYIGAITALSFSPDNEHIVYGSGKSIWIYDNKKFKKVSTFPALSIASIHGIRFNNNIMCVFGQKEFAIYSWSELKENGFQNTQPLYHNTQFIDWIWDVCFLDTNSTDYSKIAVGTAHNTVIFWDTVKNEVIECFYGKERCILYSMSILNLHGDLIVASGTVFSQVHIWSIHHPDRTHICKKHNGVIFKVRWSSDGRHLLSVSDDRSLVLWKHSSSTEPWWVSVDTPVQILIEGDYSVEHSFFGHTARLWDCLFTPSCLVTSSEDCTVRFWNADGACIATFGGHRGKHIWCLAYDPVNQRVLTGGNDNSIKIWDEKSILHSYQNTTTQTYTIPTMVGMNPNEPRNSKSECIREIVVADENSVFVASNWGYVWRFNIREENWHSIYTPESHCSVSAMAMNDAKTVVVSGDSSGVVQVISLCDQFTPQELRPCSIRISKIFLSDDNNGDLWIFVIAADSTIYLYQLVSNVIHYRTQLRCVTKGVAVAALWLSAFTTLFVSDSLGSVHVNQFQWIDSELALRQSSSIRCHGTSPITCLQWHENQLWTGGNDGKIVSLVVQWDPLVLSINTPLAVPNIKQVLSIWWSEENELCCAGYHESLYYVYDMTNMYEVLCTPAGGWKRPCSSYTHHQHPLCGYVYAYASFGGFSDICVFLKQFETSSRYPSLNTPSHGKEINVVHWIEAEGEEGLLATGGEDRKFQIVQTTAKETIEWEILHSYEVHSSCIRCITSCKLNNNRDYLVISCGGRNTICVWTVNAKERLCSLQATYPYRNSLNCSDEGDQRIMDVAILKGASHFYLVTGDSCGKLHVFSLSEDFTPTLLYTSAIHTTPVLSLALAQTPSGIFIIAGVAAGDLIAIEITEAIAAFEAGKDFMIPPAAFSLFSAVHIMGINDLKVRVEGETICCFTVGDDQSLHVTCLEKEATIVCKRRIQNDLISGTSLRSLALVGNTIFTTGWEQKVQQWTWEKGEVKKIGEMHVQAPETGSVDCISNGHTVYGSVCGDMGFEVFECVL